MANLLHSHSHLFNLPCKLQSASSINGSFRVRATVNSPERRSKKKRQSKQQQPLPKSDDSALASISATEKSLRFSFMEELMERARNRDSLGVSEVIYDMIAAGLSPGPRSFHGLIVSHTLNGDAEGAMQSLRRELSAGLCPLHETFIALVRLFGSKGYATRGLEILAAMEKLNYDIRQAWLVLVEELVKNKHLEDANKVLLKGAKGGLRATDELYDLVIEEDCKAGDHSNALEISYEMEAAGRMATTFHFNCLLSVQATCGIPEIAFATFENMEYGEDYMKPDTETYNWVIQAFTRAESYDRVQDVAELLGMMVEDHKRLQPNMRTYARQLEYLGYVISGSGLAADPAKVVSGVFTKYCVVREAIRHFRALRNFEGGSRALHNEGNFGDPLSLYLRALCREEFKTFFMELFHPLYMTEVITYYSWDKRHLAAYALKLIIFGLFDPMLFSGKIFDSGRIVELLEALEAMAKDNQPIPPRAMILSKKYRTLVSSWIEPLQEEAELGYEIDYIARYIAEGGLTGERKRWVPRRGKTPLDPDVDGFIYSNPMETSFKQRCLDDWKIYHRKLLICLQNEGLSTLGDASEADYIRVEEKLKKIIKGPDQNVLKPKAASKMVVPELKEELEAQGLPTDGNRNVLYQRVQKARRINRSRGRPLWVPPVEEEEEEVDEELDELISRIKLEEGNTEFWKRRFLGEGMDTNRANYIDVNKVEPEEVLDDIDIVDVAKEIEDDEGDEEEDVEQTENQDGERVKKEVESKRPLQMIGVQLLKDSDQTPVTSKKLRRRSRASLEDDRDEDWFPEDIFEAFKELRNRNVFDVSDMYTIADVWGWTWEKELKNRPPRRWSQEWEIELAINIMLKVIELGGTPTIGDIAMILRAAIRAPLPSAFLKILQTAHSLGYVFGSPLYDEIIFLCLDLGEVDAAIAIVADLETAGISVPVETLDRVILSRQTSNGAASDETT